MPTSICRSIVTICSGLYLCMGMTRFSSKWILSHSTWYKLGRSGHQDLVLGLHLLLQELNPFLFLLRLAARTFRRVEGGRSVLEELFLPAVEHRRLQAQLFTQIGNRNLV